MGDSSGGSLIDGQAQTQPITQTGAEGSVVPAPAGNPEKAAEVAVPAPQGEHYKPFTTPEGVSFDDKTHGSLTALGKELNLTQEQMQKFVDLGVSRFTDGQEAVRLKVLDEIKEKFGEWEDQSMSDDEIKPYLNDKGKLPKVSEFINRAMGNSDDTKKFLDMAAETGIGFNPLFIKFCIRAGKLMGEASFLEASRGGNKPVSMLSLEEQANAMFGHTMK